MGDPAILLLRDDGEVWINSECTALMFSPKSCRSGSTRSANDE